MFFCHYGVSVDCEVSVGLFIYIFILHRLCSFSIPEDCAPEKEFEEGDDACEVEYQPPEITPLYGVTARLELLFQDAHKKLRVETFYLFFKFVSGSIEVLSK